MRLSAFNIWNRWADRRAQQEREIRENTPQPNRTIDMWKHTEWGNSIGWMKWEERRLYGHFTPLPKRGDIVRSRMESGKIARFIITTVEYCSDPSDMFFATVKDAGYEEQP